MLELGDRKPPQEAETAFKGHKFFNVWRFVAPLQRWVAKNKHRRRAIVQG